MGTVRIEVTREDIRDGQRFNGHTCPVALALKRAGVPAIVGYASVSLQKVRDDDDFMYEVDLPSPIPEWIQRFDDLTLLGLPRMFIRRPKPFWLEIPDVGKNSESVS